MSWENAHRRNPDETLAAFDTKGRKVIELGGKGARVNVPRSEMQRIDATMKDKILTHNHPRALGQQGYYSIGNSFSVQDLATAVRTNAKEIRAVTPRYTFSFRRTGKSWKINASEVANVYRDVERSVKLGPKGLDSYVYILGTDTAAGRADATLFHRIAREFAKRIGARYTKKKG